MKAIDLNKIINLPTREKIVLWFGVAIAVLLSGYFLNIKITLTELNQIKQRGIALQTTLDQQQTQLELFKNKQKLLKSNPEQQTIIKLLSSSFNLTQLLAELMHISQKNQMRVQLLEPQAMIEKNKFSIQPVHVVMIGNYYQYQSWLNDLSHLPLVIVLQGLIMKTAPAEMSSEHNLILDIYLEIYKYKIPRVNVGSA